MGDFNDAIRRLYPIREVDLECPKCHAANRPGATIIQLEHDRSATCGVCAHHFHTKE